MPLQTHLVPSLLLTACFLGTATPASAQSLTAGSLRGTVESQDGGGLPGVQVTLETADGGSFRNLETDRTGAFAVALLAPGTYRILAEQVGFQPVRRLGVIVSAGQVTVVTIVLERRPPPIASVTEVDQPASGTGAALSRLISDRESRRFGFRREVTDLSRGLSEVDAPRDGRDGFAASALGLPGSWSRLYVDAIPEVLLRHPGVPGEPAVAPIFARDGLDQVQLLSSATDAEWRGVSGAILSAQSRRGSGPISLQPYVSGSSAGLGGRGGQNPADFQATSLQAGAVLSGAIVPDTAFFLLRADLRRIETPTASPWSDDGALYNGQPVPLGRTIGAIAADSFGTQLGSGVDPVVRTWKGGSVFGRLDWQLSRASALMARAGFATWTETRPQLGREVGNEDGAELSARDFSAAVSVTSIGGSVANEARLGFAASRREWNASPLPATYLVAEGVRFGGSAALPALFDRAGVSLADAVQLSRGRHQLKFGMTLDFTNWEQDYRYGSTGVFYFGGLQQFGPGDGVFWQTRGSEGSVSFTTTDMGLFLQDTYAATPDVRLLLGLRYDTQVLPKDEITPSADWLAATGVGTDYTPKDRGGVAPRLGFIWDVQGRGTWFVRGAGGLFSSGLDPALFAEALRFDQDVTVRRGSDRFDSWPARPGPPLVSDAGYRISFFSDTYRAPRTIKADLGLTGVLGGGMLLTLSGGYRHTDYLPRRVDLNRLPAAGGETQEGRPLYGTLEKQGGLLAAELGSSRRFDEFDLVTALVPTGFSDAYEATASLERRATQGLSLLASYTFSRVRDNLTGLLAPDPADQLSPFPEGIVGADWDEGRSDLDIPHRLVGYLEYRSGGRTGLILGARARYRSGLPFTPGFPPGVDPNGDLGADNDPAYLDSSVQATLAGADCAGSLNRFAERNSCREQGVGSLDLRLGIELPVRLGGGSRLSLIVDAFNVVATETGIVDRALVLVDPAGSLSTAGRVTTLPLIANSRFGTLLSRRGEPRVVRVGLGIEY